MSAVDGNSLSDLGVVIKGDNHWLGVGPPKVPMHRNCHVF